VKEEARLHLQRANDCIKDAEVLLNAHRPSAAVGRTYYAMFHAATAALLERDIKRHSHQGLISNAVNTSRLTITVIPAKAGIQKIHCLT